MQFNDSHAAEFGQDSGEVRAIYVTWLNCCFHFASPQLGTTFSAPASDTATCQTSHTPGMPLLCPWQQHSGLQAGAAQQLQTHPVPQRRGIRAREQSGSSQSSALHFLLPVC